MLVLTFTLNIIILVSWRQTPDDTSTNTTYLSKREPDRIYSWFDDFHPAHYDVFTKDFLGL
jgi:hypothetical protein